MENSSLKPVHLVIEDDIELIKSRLVAIGANNASNSYDAQDKKVLESFLKLPLPSIAPSWEYLKADLKIRIIDEHKEEFDRFILGGHNAR